MAAAWLMQVAPPSSLSLGKAMAGCGCWRAIVFWASPAAFRALERIQKTS